MCLETDPTMSGDMLSSDFNWGPEKYEVHPGDHSLLLHELVENQVARTPDLPAVVEADGTTYTYRQLDDKANLLAAWLRTKGSKPNAVVGILMERCAEYVVAYLAALKAGAAYAPFEVAYPKAMLDGVIDDVKPVAVLTKKEFAPILDASQTSINLDAGWEVEIRKDPPGPEFLANTVEPTQDDLVYVIYSSGSTGKPKGILAPHRSPVHSYVWREAALSGYGPGHKVACSVFFVWECLRPLMRGGSCYVIPDDMIYDTPALADFLYRHEITEILFTPSLAQTLLATLPAEEIKVKLQHMRALLLNGEVVTTHLLRRCEALLPAECRILNIYSISECGEVCCLDLRKEHDPVAFPKFCSVGKAAAFVRLLILDEDKELVPEGEVGELYIGGDAIGFGYLEMPEVTAERFITHPRTGIKLYRSGDLARVKPSGLVEILGRCGFMVKVRGYSVVLSAVETAVVEAVAVKSCLVEAVGEEGTDKRLVAYIVPDPDVRGRVSGWKIDEHGGCPELVHALRKVLAHYMVPWVYVELSTLPMMPAPMNKVDRKRLPEPPAPRELHLLADDFTMDLSAAPGVHEVEGVVLKAIEEELSIEPGHATGRDSFFDLGGHSLAAARLTSRLQKIFGCPVPIKTFLQDPTAAAVASRLLGASDPRAAPEERMLEDAELGEELEGLVSRAAAAGGADPPPSLGDAGCALLTGATGFLGGALLARLVEAAPTMAIRCLVRPRTGGGGALAPIRAMLEPRGLWTEAVAAAADSGRLAGVPGDVSKPLLGLPAAEYEALAGEVDLVLHCAAHVNLVLPYGELRSANVGGARNVLAFAAAGGRARPLHYISTNGVCPWGTEATHNHLWKEDAPLEADHIHSLDGGYAQTKWVAETLVARARALGLPAAVYRPGNQGGDSRSGAFNAADGMMLLMGACAMAGAAPVADGWEMEMAPVDWTAGAVSALMARGQGTLGGTFHLMHPRPIPGAEAVAAMEASGYRLERKPLAEWLAQAKALPSCGGPMDGLAALLDYAGDEGPRGGGELWRAGRFDTSAADAALAGTGWERPEITAALIQTYVSRAVADQYMPGPKP